MLLLQQLLLVYGPYSISKLQDIYNPLFGAIIVSLTAVIVGLVFLLPRLGKTNLVSNPKGWIFVILAGVMALLLDFFVLKAYNSGLSVSIGGPIIIGGSITIAAIIGLFLGESITLLKIIGLLLTIIGSGILASYSG